MSLGVALQGQWQGYEVNGDHGDAFRTGASLTIHSDQCVGINLAFVLHDSHISSANLSMFQR